LLKPDRSFTVRVLQARKLLEARLAEIGHSSAVLVAEASERDGTDLSRLRQHQSDEGTDISDAEREGAVLDAQAADRLLIEQALARLDAGTFGKCVDCGKAIPNARLEARPEVSRCMEDQQRFERLR
jgi:DnaK suppressor protein